MYHTIEYTRKFERSWFSGTFEECEREKKKREDMGFEVKYVDKKSATKATESIDNTGINSKLEV
jgi:hypothetical protein